jgi:hypothetical protein
MKRTLPLISALVALLVVSDGGLAAGFGGHNPQTRKLEAAFSTALSARIDSKNGCYPAPPQLAKLIRKRRGFGTGVAGGIGSARVQGLVYVLRRGSSCNNVRMVLRQGAVFLLDSTRGEIKVLGRRAALARRAAAARGNRGPLRAVRVVTKTSRLATTHRRVRFEARCPGRTSPLGGGVSTSPGLGADGEGVYPQSFERLGAQRGWHVTAWLFDPGGGKAGARKVTVQVVCGLGLVPMRSPHTTVFIKPGETKTAIARCPRGQQLMSGGFQRTDFLNDGGNFVTESRAIGPNAWRVSGAAYGDYGGELTAIAYCVRSKQPLISEVSASVPLPFGAAATATTPPCPPGARLAFGGFSANGSVQTFFSSGTINDDGTWSATSFGIAGPAPSLTAYGYCLLPGV